MQNMAKLEQKLNFKMFKKLLSDILFCSPDPVDSSLVVTSSLGPKMPYPAAVNARIWKTYAVLGFRLLTVAEVDFDFTVE